GMEAGRRLSGLEAREAEDALLGLPGIPVIKHLLVRACRNARAPAAAAVLVDKHDAVLAALIESAGRARRHTCRIQPVVADARKVKEDQAFHSEQLLLLLRSEALQVGVVLRVDG